MPQPKYHNTTLELSGWKRNQETLWKKIKPAPTGAVEKTLRKALKDVTDRLTKVDAE